MSCFPCCRRSSAPSPVEFLLPEKLSQKELLQQLFSQSDDALYEEFNKIRTYSDYDLSSQIDMPGHPNLCSNYCVDRTIILTEAPTYKNYETFQEIAHREADAIITLMQKFDYTCRRESIPYFFEQLVQPSDCPWDCPPPYLPHAIVRSNLTVNSIDPRKPPKEIPHFHYDNWPDGMGIDPNNLARLVRVAMQYKKPIIHCIAGVGRSGTLAAALSAYRKILAGDCSLDLVENVILELRKERPFAVASPSQYVSIYRALQILVEEDGLM